MATLKGKEVRKMTQSEREKKLLELKLELIKSKASASKGGTSKIREARRAIAKILTFNKSQKEELKNK